MAPGSGPPRPPGGGQLPARFLTLDYPESTQPGPPPPPLAAPSFRPSPGGAGTARRRLDPRRRRTIEIIALVTLLPLTLGLQWFDQVRQIRIGLEPDETITVVPSGRTGQLAHARWVLLGRVNGDQPTPVSSRGLPKGATTITLSMGMKALDPLGSKEATTANLKFRLVDRAGHEWSAEAEYKGEPSVTSRPPVNQPIPITVTAEVPQHLAGQLVVDVVQSGAFRPKGAVRVLRFAH